MTHDDLVNYEVKVSRALEGTYRSRKVYTTHAPTSGPVLLHMLNLMEKYELPAEGRTDVNVHRLIEAMKCKHALLNELCVISDLFNNSWLCCTVRYYPVTSTLLRALLRTRLSDPAFNDDPDRIDKIPLKSYGTSISKNMTDVRRHSSFFYHLY